jgi:tRNA(Ile)-lysidine synthase
MGRSELGSDAIVAAVSGGPDSVFLVHWCRKRFALVLLGHLNHGARGRESEEDQRFVERMSRRIGLPLEVGKVLVPRRIHPWSGGKGRKGTASFEQRARKVRYAFLLDLKDKHRAKKLLVAHTADDQVETVLMRILEGAGIAGLKGIPRRTGDGIERPLLDTWREDILKYLMGPPCPSSFAGKKIRKVSEETDLHAGGAFS